ncbi:Tetratricopeptide repeat-containing protein [Flavobacterium swingsii]|uniref:Tetratricopeptide repeat-containing protein n=1 Tax=Flavobacterium swingsii TaxID=498292 RepID=A0A1I0Z0U0_9FLAO|nr:tetratricopeptide repeat protein [Flavobacterium swingsii]SFB19151.1 Tetratricopeptide repeat-containing protein [Flavobacterium swingsii]
MKKIVLLFILTSYCFGQSNPKDALKKINSYSKKDTVKVEMIVDYCVANTFSNSAKVLKMAQEAYVISKEIKYTLGEIRSLNCIGNSYYQQAIYDKAIANYTKALSIAEKLKDTKNIVIGKNNLGNLYVRTNQPEKALPILKEADSILVESGQEFTQTRAAILTNIGGLYSSLKKHKEAIEYHKKTLKLCEKLKISFGIAIATCNIGEEYVLLQDYKTAFGYLKKSQLLSEKEGFDNFLGKNYKNIGVVLWHQNKKEEAFEYLKKAIVVCEKTNEQNVIIETLEILQQYYAESNDYKNAFLTSLKLKKVNHSVISIEKQKAVSEINTKYETEKKQNHIVSLKKDNDIANLENKRQKSIVLSLSLFILSLLIFGYFIFNRFKIKKQNELLKLQLLEAEKTIIAEKKASQSELKALKSQMNPHFFFNALNTIQSYIATNETEEATDYLNKFSKLTRIILEMTDKNWITIDEEIKMQTLYLNLQKTRLSNFDFQINIKNNSIHNATIPTMLLQPYIENAVIHGLSHKLGKRNLWVNFEINTKNQLKIEIKDNGIGLTKANEINQKNANKNTSFATKATLERLEIINRNDLKIAIETNELFDDNEKSEGTEIKITMDLRYE